MALPAAHPSQFFDEGIKLISYCPLCQSSCSPRETHVLGERDDSHLLHIRCGGCSNAILALVLVSSAGVSSVGLVTDLDHEEVERFRVAPSVSTDDVIEMHCLLEQEETLFSRLGVA
ncbi:MAG: hypothetical protein PHT12_00505 [Patescibacteria group bacterium]|nr:hypothetical protein [Patescibacteria group bacterium]